MAASVSASTLSRSSGSVLEARTLNHQSAWVTVSPSRSSTVVPGSSANARRTRSVAARWSGTDEFTSPLATYLL